MRDVGKGADGRGKKRESHGGREEEKVGGKEGEEKEVEEGEEKEKGKGGEKRHHAEILLREGEVVKNKMERKGQE